MRENKLKLSRLLEIGRAFDQVEYQAPIIEGKQVDGMTVVDVIKKNKNVAWKSCFKCGGSYQHDGDCPARNKECRKCGKIEH